MVRISVILAGKERALNEEGNFCYLPDRTPEGALPRTSDSGRLRAGLVPSPCHPPPRCPVVCSLAH